MFPSSSKQRFCSELRDFLDIHETSASEAEFYETSSSETDMGVDHLFMVVWVARIIYIYITFIYFLLICEAQSLWRRVAKNSSWYKDF